MLEQKIEQDLKAALLARDQLRVTVLRNVKSVLLNVKVNTGKRQTGLTDDEVLPLLSKEAKKRQESADLYIQGGDQKRADTELAEKVIIEEYLPAQLSEAEIGDLIDNVMEVKGLHTKNEMGQIISSVKDQAKGAADGAVISRLVKEKLNI